MYLAALSRYLWKIKKGKNLVKSKEANLNVVISSNRITRLHVVISMPSSSTSVETKPDFRFKKLFC